MERVFDKLNLVLTFTSCSIKRNISCLALAHEGALQVEAEGALGVTPLFH